MEPYRTLYPDASDRLPRTEAVAERVLVLPTGLGVGPDDVEKVAGIIRDAVRPPV